MAGNVYISCERDERELPEVAALCRVLRESACEIHFAPFTVEWCGYRQLEDLIERADAFVAVAGRGYDSATWLNHELTYADALRRFRFDHRPRIFGLRIGKYLLPRCSEHIALEWIDSSTQSFVATSQEQLQL